MSRPWQPLLEGELADRARTAIDHIAEELGPPKAVDGEISTELYNLPGGSAGIALFYAYFAEAERASDAESERAQNLAIEHLETSLGLAASQPFAIGLWEGLVGTSWCYDHLEGRLFEADEEEDPEGTEKASEAEDEDTSDTDLFLIRYLESRGQSRTYDLIQGLAGFGLACFEGFPRSGARRALEKVVDLLVANAEKQRQEQPEEHCTWFTPPDQLPEWQQELAPEGYYNLGVAHGIPAVITLLARCLGAGIREDDVEPLLEGAVDWLWEQRLEGGFPSWIAKGIDPKGPARLAWCYGDPGLAASLLAAADAAGRPDWRDMALEIARVAADRDPEESGIIDAGVCHGSAGLGHIFNRLYQGTGCERMAEAARQWFGHALSHYRQDEGIGGFRAWSVPRGAQGSGELQWLDDPGLLTGSAGIGLCLLAATSDQEPEWDRALSISAPARKFAL